MSQIYKFELKKGQNQITEIVVPSGQQLLSVGVQNDQIVLWAKIHRQSPNESVKLRVVWTGEPFNESEIYIGTVQIGIFVYHVLEIIK